MRAAVVLHGGRWIRQEVAMSKTVQTTALFPLGRVLLTPGAMEVLSDAGQMANEFLCRHARLEPGELCDEDHRENLFSVDKELRIFSAFKTARGVKLWCITEADRSCTTLLLPSEY
jgi:hypothetical protein